MIELLILFAVAAFVLYRLKSVLGTRTGYETPPDYTNGKDRRDAQASGDVSAAEASVVDESSLMHPLPDGARAALEGMKKAEPSFSLGPFLEGARSAYEMILMAYEEGDRETLKSLLAPDVYQTFEGVIAERESEGLRVEARFIGMRDLRVQSVEFDAETAEANVTLRFVGEMITTVRDSENRVVEGDPNEISRQTDVWTFSRVMGSPSPNWLLTATGE